MSSEQGSLRIIGTFIDVLLCTHPMVQLICHELFSPIGWAENCRYQLSFDAIRIYTFLEYLKINIKKEHLTKLYHFTLVSSKSVCICCTW